MAAGIVPLLPDQSQEYPEIPGLVGMAGFIQRDRETCIINYLDARSWQQVIPGAKTSRKVQQFGYPYSYSSKSIEHVPIGPLEDNILYLADHLQRERWLAQPGTPGVPNLQCIANEYYRNQGITPHIDNSQFGPSIVSVSLLEDTVMTFTHKDTSESHDVFLPRRGILIMESDARYKWKHSIKNTVTYIDPQGNKIAKPANYRRISLTYRTVSM